jgi:hypothetical protein
MYINAYTYMCISIYIYTFRVTDVSSLGNAYSLNLSHCYQLTDVDALSSVRLLDISGCYRITNVNTLRNVYSLNLSCCSRITDVSMLGRVHTLDISYFNRCFHDDDHNISQFYVILLMPIKGLVCMPHVYAYRELNL